MSTLGEEIKGIIVRALPNLSEETQLHLISRLQSSGLESKEDLKYVQQEDMADLLPVIQLRKLLDAFKSGIANMAQCDFGLKLTLPPVTTVNVWLCADFFYMPLSI